MTVLFQILSSAVDTGKHFASLNYVLRLHKKPHEATDLFLIQLVCLLNLLLCDLSVCAHVYLCVCVCVCVCVWRCLTNEHE